MPVHAKWPLIPELQYPNSALLLSCSIIALCNFSGNLDIKFVSKAKCSIVFLICVTDEVLSMIWLTGE